MTWTAAVVGVARVNLGFSFGVDVTFELSNSITKETLTCNVTLPSAGFIPAAGIRLVQQLTDTDTAVETYASASPLTPMQMVD